MFRKQTELDELKAKARKLYLAAQSRGDLDCGRQLEEMIRPGLGVARQEFNKVWERIRELDPTAPKNPLAN